MPKKLNEGVNESSLNIEQKLSNLVIDYNTNNKEYKNYEKICKNQNTEIKDLMKKLDISEFEASNVIATVSTSVREDFDSDKLLNVLKNADLFSCIKTIEVVDIEALEKLAFSHSISDEVMLEIDKCRVQKEVITLRVKEKKEKE